MDKVNVTVPAWLVNYWKLALLCGVIYVALSLGVTLAWNAFAVQGLRLGYINLDGGFGFVFFVYVALMAIYLMRDEK